MANKCSAIVHRDGYLTIRLALPAPICEDAGSTYRARLPSEKIPTAETERHQCRQFIVTGRLPAPEMASSMTFALFPLAIIFLAMPEIASAQLLPGLNLPLLGGPNAPLLPGVVLPILGGSNSPLLPGVNLPILGGSNSPLLPGVVLPGSNSPTSGSNPPLLPGLNLPLLPPIPLYPIPLPPALNISLPPLLPIDLNPHPSPPPPPPCKTACFRSFSECDFYFIGNRRRVPTFTLVAEGGQFGPLIRVRARKTMRILTVGVEASSTSVRSQCPIPAEPRFMTLFSASG